MRRSGRASSGKAVGVAATAACGASLTRQILGQLVGELFQLGVVAADLLEVSRGLLLESAAARRAKRRARRRGNDRKGCDE
jgi:hypothetical protein